MFFFKTKRTIVKLTHPIVEATDNGHLDFSTRRLFIFDKTNKLNFLIDSGADISVLPSSKFKSHKKISDIILTAANGSSISTFGKKMLNINLGLRREFSFFFTIANIEKPIIGADFLHKYGLLIDIKNKKLIDPLIKLSINAFSHYCKVLLPKIFSINNRFY